LQALLAVFDSVDRFMNKVIIAGIFLIIIIGGGLSYNDLVTKAEGVNEAFSQIQSNIQRKVDLLPNLVKVVKTYANHERKTFQEITKLRTQRVNTNSGHVTKEQIEELIQTDRAANHSTLRLFAVAERYPSLRSSEHFLQLQAQIEGTENRINISRMDYNKAVKAFNALIQRIPTNILARKLGYEKKPYFHIKSENQGDIDLDL